LPLNTSILLNPSNASLNTQAHFDRKSATLDLKKKKKEKISEAWGESILGITIQGQMGILSYIKT